MIRFLIQVVVNLITAAVALLLAGVLIGGVTVRPIGLITATIVFVLANGLFSPWVYKMADRYAPAVVGGVGLVSTLIALFIATLIGNGLTISGFIDWVMATLLVWIITALGGWLLLSWWLKRRVKARRSGDTAGE